MNLSGVLYINSSSGNVGIGTTAPGYKLEVSGTAHLRGADATTGLYVTPTGNVAIGTTNPYAYKLHVNGAAYLGAGNFIGSTTINQGTAATSTVGTTFDQRLGSTGSTQAGFGIRNIFKLTDSVPNAAEDAGAIDVLWVDATSGSEDSAIVFSGKTAGAALAEWVRLVGGNVGIGTTAPSQRLSVGSGNITLDDGYWVGQSSSYGFYPFVSSAQPYTRLNAGSSMRVDIDNNNNETGAYLDFSHNNGTVLARLQEDGNFGIGTTAPVEKFEVAGSIRIAGRIRQGSLGDLAEMIHLAPCVLDPSKVIINAPQIKIKIQKDKKEVVLDKEAYAKYALSPPEPGDVVIIDNEGGIRRSFERFSTSVVGIISTSPAQILREDLKDAAAVTLSGIIPCKVTIENGPITPGNLLVSSSIPGYAMRAGSDPAPGTVVAKALGRLDKDKETGVIEVLVTLK